LAAVLAAHPLAIGSQARLQIRLCPTFEEGADGDFALFFDSRGLDLCAVCLDLLLAGLSRADTAGSQIPQPSRLFACLRQ
jgi:hypothetical protein